MATYDDSLQGLLKAAKVAKAKGDKVELARIRAEYERLKRLEKGPGVLEGLARSGLGQGLALGFGDEIEAGVRSMLPGGKSYDEELAYARALQDKFAEQSPYLNFGAQAASGLVPGAGIGKLASLGMKGASRLRQLMGAGAAEGALFGAGTAEGGLGDRLLGAGVGATLGAGAGALGRGAERWMAGKGARQAQRILERRLDGMDPAAARQAMEALGPDAMLADIGPQMRGVAGEAYRRAETGRDVAKDLLEARQRGQGARISTAVENVTGVQETPLQAAERLAAGRKAAADVNYGKVRGQPIAVTPAMLQKLEFPEGQRAAQRALARLRMEYNNPELTLEDAVHGLDFWDEWQKGVRSMAESAGVSGDKHLAQMTSGIRRKVLDELDTQLPGYAQARGEFAAQSRIMEATQGGGDFFMVTPEELSRRVMKMSPEERQGLVTGAIGAIMKKIGNAPDSANTARNLLKTPYLRDKFRILLGPDKAEELLARFDDEIAKLETYGEMLRGSQTAERLAQGELMSPGALAANSMLDNLMQRNLNPLDYASDALRALTRRPANMDPGTAEQLLKLTTEMDPAAMERMLMEALRATPMNQTTVPALMGGAGAVLAPQLSPEQMYIEITAPQ